MASSVTENETTNKEIAHPSIEIVQFTTAADGDYYDCKKLAHVDGAFACQTNTDSVELQVTWAEQANGQPGVTITLSTGTAYTGFLTIYGRL